MEETDDDTQVITLMEETGDNTHEGEITLITHLEETDDNTHGGDM